MEGRKEPEEDLHILTLVIFQGLVEEASF